MQHCMTLEFLPQSVNKNIKVSKNGMIYKDKGAKDNRKKVQYMIDNIYPHIKESIQEKFNSKKHCFQLDVYFYIPEDTFYTKKGEVSNRSGDVDNYAKNLIDDLFKAIGVDDRYVTELRLCKLPTTDKEQTIIFLNMERIEQFVNAPYDSDPFYDVESDWYL